MDELTLYLATFRLERIAYMCNSDRRFETKMRLIKASHLVDAEDLLRKEVERDDPYGVSYRVTDLDISACIE